MDRHHKFRRFGAAGVAAAALLALPGAAAATPADRALEHGSQRRCERTFDEAQRVDMETFRDYDAETWRDTHHPDAVSIFGSGQVFYGIDAIMTALAGHFADREALWSWTELTRQVHGCDTAFILYETVYEIPRVSFRSRALTAVTYTYERGRWLSILDQGTALP